MIWHRNLFGLVASACTLAFALAHQEPVNGFGELQHADPADIGQAEEGRLLFGQMWVADQPRFNSQICANCHGTPAYGGTAKESKYLAHMIPSETDPSGFEPFQNYDRSGAPREIPPEAETRRPIPLYGIGLLESVPEKEILSRADPDDKNHDGISGRAIRVGGNIGRFGWKANVPTISDFVLSAFKNELGVKLRKGRDVAEQDLTLEKVDQVTTYLRLISAPPSKPSDLGEKLFERIGCAGCHAPTLKTPTQEIHPYTDLLLHDMGPGKATPVNGPKVKRREYRTAPLWGIGGIGGPYWHDASAPTAEAAIEKHEGEALASRANYRKLSPKEQALMRNFLAHL